MEGFNGLDRDVETSPKRWKKIVESSCPEKEKLPQDWKNKSSFQKLIILRALRPDRTTYALQYVNNPKYIYICLLCITQLLIMVSCRTFIEESMGTKYVESVRLKFEKLYEDSDPSTPVFFILSPGVDPLRDVEKLGNTVHVCSL